MNPLRRAIHGMMQATGLDRHVDEYALNHWIERLHASRFPVMSDGGANAWIGQLIASRQPAAIGKIGDRECCALSAHLGFRQFYKYTWTSPSFSESDLHRQAGVFPPSEQTYRRFAETFLNSLSDLDACGVWHNPGESKILLDYCPKARRIPILALEPYFFPDPWSRHLAGKRVLVVHPFAKSIRSQFSRRAQIWESHQAVLPSFELETLTSPYGFSQTQFRDWVEMLRSLETQVEAIYRRRPFDVALIGCGAAGLPLASFVKRRLGAIGLHTGGPTQLFFGIRGARWDKMPEFHKFMNNAWVRPRAEETPSVAGQVDNGGYW